MTNECIFVGNLVSDPVYYEGETSRVVFTLAVDHDGKPKEGQKNAEYLDFIAWRSVAEYIGRYAHKGDLLSVVSMAQKHEKVNPQGEKSYRTEFQVKSVNILSRFRSGD